MTTDLKGLIERWRSGDKPGNPGGCYGLSRIEAGNDLVTALESILSRQPFEHEGKSWQVLPVAPSDAMLTALNGYAQCEGFIPEGYAAMLTASAEEAKPTFFPIKIVPNSSLDSDKAVFVQDGKIVGVIANLGTAEEAKK